MKMTDAQIYKKIEEIYNNEKGQTFITHLIRSFLPVTRSQFMLENNSKKVMKCAITDTPLISKGELVAFQIENHKEIFKNMTERLFGEANGNLVADNFKGKMLAVESEKSKRVLCLNAVQQLLNFVSTELLRGNKHICYIVSDERKKEAGANVEGGQVNPFSKLPTKHYNKVEKQVFAHSTTSLGDLSVLQNLKNKLEGEGK